MAQSNTVPNLYQLASDEVEITYTLSNENGQPELSYRGPRGELTFTGDQVRIERSVLGMLATVFLVRTVDTGSVTLTLLVPGVNLAGMAEQIVQSIAIETNNSFSIVNRNKPRQTQTYQVYQVEGVAR